MIGTDIAIDLGTSRFKVYLDGKGIVVSEPSIIAVDNLTDEVIAIGSDAYDMLGRTSERITVSRPLSNGVISNFSMAEQLISYYLKQISSSRVFMPRVVVSVPCNVTEVEKRAVVEAITAAGVRKVCLIEEPVAAAIGAGVDIAVPHGTMIVDIGEGATDMAVISLNGIAVANSCNIAGASFNDAIVKYVRKKFNLIIEEEQCFSLRESPVIQEHFAWAGLPAPEAYHLSRLEEHPVLQFLAYITPQEYGRLAPLRHIEITGSGHSIADIIPLGGGKEVGIAAVAQRFGWKREEIMVFGDGPNDAKMLAWAGAGVAMGNGVEGAKAAADYVTTPVGEDGVKNALLHFGVLEETEL